MAKRYELSDASWEVIKYRVSPKQKMARPPRMFVWSLDMMLQNQNIAAR